METITHGGYRAVRVVELADTSAGEISRLLSGCSYLASGHGPRLVAGVRMALESGGSYAYGWVDWELVGRGDK